MLERALAEGESLCLTGVVDGEARTQAAPSIDARDEGAASLPRSLLLAVGSFELVILVGALVPAMISLVTPPQYLPAPDWVNRWAGSAAQATLIALPAALALHAVIQAALRRRRLHWALQAAWYGGLGAAAGLLIALGGAVLGQDFGATALFAVPIAVFVGTLGRASLALLSSRPRIGAAVAACATALGILAVALVQPWG